MVNNGVNKKCILVITAVLLVSAFHFLPLKEKEGGTPTQYEGYGPGADFETDGPQIPRSGGTRGSTPRTVLAEFFANWGCPYCPIANTAMNELLDAYPPSELVMITYRIDYPRNDDPFYTYNKPDNKERGAHYLIKTTGVPVVYFDGPPWLTRIDGDPPGTYQRFKNRVEAELANLSNLTITLDGNLDPVTMNGTINATIEVTDTLPLGNLTLQFTVVEDNKYAASPNGETCNRYNMRDILINESLPALTVGETYSASRTFPIDPIFNLNSTSVVVFVQNDDDRDILQTAMYDFVPQDILVVDDDETVNPEGYEDAYHELLCEMEYSFDGWTLNERGNPTSDDLSNYDAVIWITADTASSTLTTTDQTAISNYLDNGKGSLFITGENIGADIGSSPFYQDYLHSTFDSDDIGDSQIGGIDSDPISDPFFGMTVDIAGSSPSAITPEGSASSVFLYSPSGNTSGIKSIHDVDSKVVYFAFMYFEGTDSSSNKMILMENILNWMVDFNLTIPLSEGWNMVSIPYIQSDTSFAAVLESISGEYDALQWYDPTDSMDPWKHYSSKKPSQMNDLTDITHGISFWINITTPGGTVMGCKGVEPSTNQSIPLHVGWNHVGYPSLVGRTVDSAMNNIEFGTEVDAVWTYDAATRQWEKLGPADVFEPGGGYWIHSTVEKIWDVPL